MPAPAARARGRRRRALSHQCEQCRALWALRVIDHPAGRVVRCRFCGVVVREIALPDASVQQ